MQVWIQIIETACQIADSQLWKCILPPLAAAMLKLLGHVTKLNRRKRILAEIVNLAQLQGYLNESRKVMSSLDNDLLSEFASILTVEIERNFPPFRFTPDYYNPRSNLFQLRVERPYLRRMFNLLQDSSVTLIIHNVIDELYLLLNIFRRIQLARTELKKFPHRKTLYWQSIQTLQKDKQLVRQQIRKLVADYAEQDLDSTLPTETALQQMDMEEFKSRCERYDEYREIVGSEKVAS